MNERHFENDQHALVVGMVLMSLTRSVSDHIRGLEEGAEPLLHNVRPVMKEGNYTNQYEIDSGDKTWVITIDPQGETDG